MRSTFALLALLAGAACVIGGNVANFGPAQSPAGDRVRIDLTRGELEGELLAVDESSLLVLADSHLVRVPFSTVRLLEPWHGNPVWNLGAANGPERAAPLRPLSRFPQGVSAELLRRLLLRYGQDSVSVVRP